MVITIDGLSTNGKTTLASRIASSINFKNFNTGAIYRCVAYYILENDLNVEDIKNVLEHIRTIKIDFIGDKVYLNDKDVSLDIRTEQIDFYSTELASIPEIRNFVKSFQKNFISKNDTVMEGRDIGSRIADNADIKFYLYADIDTRAKRFSHKYKNISLGDAKRHLMEIDKMEIESEQFLKPVGAIEIDSTNLSLDEVYLLMMKEINKILK